jgi:hypothetical protein
VLRPVGTHGFVLLLQERRKLFHTLLVLIECSFFLFFFFPWQNFVFVIFWYQLYCGFSGTVMVDQIYLMFFNLFFTSLPPLAMGTYSLFQATIFRVWVCKFLISHITRLHRDLRPECFSGIAPLSTSFVRCRAWSTAIPLTLVLGEHYRRSLSKHSDILHSLLRKCFWKRKFCSGRLMI